MISTVGTDLKSIYARLRKMACKIQIQYLLHLNFTLTLLLPKTNLSIETYLETFMEKIMRS